MKRFIITEEDRNHIMGLYEQNENKCGLCEYLKNGECIDLNKNGYHSTVTELIEWYRQKLKTNKDFFILENNPELKYLYDGMKHRFKNETDLAEFWWEMASQECQHGEGEGIRMRYEKVKKKYGNGECPECFTPPQEMYV